MNERPVVLITGGGTGVGRACSLQFAERGYDVVVNYSRSAREAEETVEELKKIGTRASLHCCDVSNDAEVRKMIAQVEHDYGRLDVLINNAAMTHFIPHSDLEQMTEEIWDRILAVNTKGPFFCIRAASRLLAASGMGSIVNVSSVAGLTGGGSCIAYSASKGALNTMTKSLAKALAPKIRVNAVCPGPIDSRWIREGNPNWNLEEMVAGYPLPRASQPKDIADAILFLAIGTTMVTGQFVVVDGGQTLS